MNLSFNPCRNHRQTSVSALLTRSHLHYTDFLCALTSGLCICVCVCETIYADSKWQAKSFTDLVTHSHNTHTIAAGYLHMVSVFLRHMMKYWRNRVGGTQCVYVCVLVKLYCLFHNRCDEIRGQVSDSTTACHGNTCLLGATLALYAHTISTHIFVHILLTCAALILRVISGFAPVLLTPGRFDLHLSLQSVTLCVCVRWYSFKLPVDQRAVWFWICSGGLCLLLSVFRLRASWSVQPRGNTQFKVWLTVGV